MNQRNELKVAYGLAVVLFVIGVLSYAAFPSKPPDEPVRVMFKVAAGKVLFDHIGHTRDTGYGIACNYCHHHPEDGSDLRACGECHTVLAEDEEFPESCIECHEEPDEIEGSETVKSADAFHVQCIDCHKEVEAGPVECAECHVL